MTDSDKQVQLFAVCLLMVCVTVIASLIGGWSGFKEAVILICVFWGAVAILAILGLRERK